MAFVWGAYGLFLFAGFVFAAARLIAETNRRNFLYLVLAPFILAVVGYTGTAVVLLLLVGLFAWAFISPENRLVPQEEALITELPRLRNAVRDDPEIVFLCLQRIGEIYETLEEWELALKYYRQAFQHKDTHRLAYKVKQLEMQAGTSSSPSKLVARTLRACPRCELIESRLAYACSHCGQVFYPDSRTWFAVRFNRWYEKAGVTAATMPGVVFLPFLFGLGPVLYGLLWAIWAFGLRTRGVL